jgi:DNA-binding transcriptional regulator YdaS (Cro superfamily)
MNLKDFIKGKSKEDLATLAAAAGTSVGNIQQIAWGHGKVSSGLARKIAAATKFEVTPHEIAPNHFEFPTDGLPPEHRAAALAANG